MAEQEGGLDGRGIHGDDRRKLGGQAEVAGTGKVALGGNDNLAPEMGFFKEAGGIGPPAVLGKCDGNVDDIRVGGDGVGETAQDDGAEADAVGIKHPVVEEDGVGGKGGDAAGDAGAVPCRVVGAAPGKREREMLPSKSLR